MQPINANNRLIIIRRRTAEQHSNPISQRFKSSISSQFRLTKELKIIFASNVQISEKISKEQRIQCEKIREIFEAGPTEKNYIQFFHHLLWFEETVASINLKRYNMFKVNLREGRVCYRGIRCYELVVPGLNEKRPSLVIGGVLYVKPNKGVRMYEAEIFEIICKKNKIVINLDRSFDQVYEKDAKFDIKFVLSTWCYECMHEAVEHVSSCEERVFPKPNTNITSILPITRYFNPLIESNCEQRRAVECIVAESSSSAPYLLHGPPGTGKTATLVEAILQIVKKYPHRQVMVCTDSNMAADHVANSLIKYAEHFPKEHWLLRANAKSRDRKAIPDTLMSNSKRNFINCFGLVETEEFLKYNIIVSTLSNAANYVRELCAGRPIQHLFIDEASQAREPLSLIACRLLSSRGQLVLAGDPYQLGPVCQSKDAAKYGLGMSLMERLQKTSSLYKDVNNDYTTMLRNNFRSDQDILELPNKFFYNGQLRAKARPDPLSKVDILGVSKHSSAVVFHGVPSCEQRMGDSPSFFNNMELDLVQQYILELIVTHKVKPHDIGVVTPYAAQASKIKIWIEKQKLKEVIEVGTVEAFQGKEKRVVIMSTVRANSEGRLGFVADHKRFNVAITRAKAKVIVIGNPKCLVKDEKWTAYIQQCRDLGSYLSFDPRSKDINQRIENKKKSNKEKNIKQNHSDITDKITPMLKTLNINKRAGIQQRFRCPFD